METPAILVPQPDVMGPSSVSTVEEEVGPAPDGASDGTALADEVPDQKDTSTPAFPSSRDEMVEMLKHVPCFTNVEPPSTKMSDFFPLTKRISVNLGGDLPFFVSARLPFGTPESTVARI